jgi:regulatory protein spx
MLIFYTSPGCSSCRKTRRWLDDHRISYVEKNLFSNKLSATEVKYLLSRCENGTSDLISTRCQAFQKLSVDIEECTVSELIVLILQNPSLLRRPILLSETNMVIGYDDDELTCLLPLMERKKLPRAKPQPAQKQPVAARMRAA